MNFISFKTAVAKAFSTMSKGQLFRTTASKDDMWNTYLSSFPEGSNPIFRERTEHDCNCCKQFIRAVGNTVSIENGKLISIWDVVIPQADDKAYEVVAKAMSDLVKSHPIDNQFLHYERTAGTDKNHEEKNGVVHTWNHFFVNIPTQFVMKGYDIASKLSELRALLCGGLLGGRICAVLGPLGS